MTLFFYIQQILTEFYAYVRVCIHACVISLKVTSKAQVIFLHSESQYNDQNTSKICVWLVNIFVDEARCKVDDLETVNRDMLLKTWPTQTVLPKTLQ